MMAYFTPLREIRARLMHKQWTNIIIRIELLKQCGVCGKTPHRLRISIEHYLFIVGCRKIVYVH